MGNEPRLQHLRLEVGDRDDIEEVVIAFRQGGDLHELASLEPPVEASIERLELEKEYQEQKRDQDQESRASRCR